MVRQDDIENHVVQVVLHKKDMVQLTPGIVDPMKFPRQVREELYKVIEKAVFIRENTPRKIVKIWAGDEGQRVVVGYRDLNTLAEWPRRDKSQGVVTCKRCDSDLGTPFLAHSGDEEVHKATCPLCRTNQIVY